MAGWVHRFWDAAPFPKAASGADPLTGALAPVEAAPLRELGLRLA